MTRRRFLPRILGFLLFSTFVTTLALAQSAPPTTYSLTEVNSLLVANMRMKYYRDGSLVLLDQSLPPSADQPKGFHSRALYNLRTHTAYTWDLIDTSVPCSPSTFSGDWGDPFQASNEYMAGFRKHNPKAVGSETVNGIAAKVWETAGPKGKGEEKLWVDEKYGLVVKWEMIGEKGPARILAEVKQLSVAKPPPSVFVLPAACANAH